MDYKLILRQRQDLLKVKSFSSVDWLNGVDIFRTQSSGNNVHNPAHKQGVAVKTETMNTFATDGVKIKWLSDYF